MFKKSSEINHEEYYDGGKLRGELLHLLDKPECDDNVRFYSIVSMNPGEEVGYHQHTGEWEVFHFMKGNGEVNDNGTIVQAAPGDVIITPSDGWHSFKNTGADNFVFSALIIRD